MTTFVLALNYVVTALIAGLSLKSRPFKLLDPAWAFLGGYFVNYCVRPTLFLIDPEMGSVYSSFYDPVIIRRGLSAALLLALLGLTGFAIGNLSFRRMAQRASQILPTLKVDDEGTGRVIWAVSFAFLLAGGAGLYGFISEAGWVGSLIELLQGGQRDAFMQVIMGHGQYMFAMQLSLIGWAMICAHWFATPLPEALSARILRRLVQLAWFLVTLGIWVAFGERSSILAVVFIPIALRQTMKKKVVTQNHESGVKKRSRVVALVLAGLFFLVAGPIGLLVKGIEMSPAAAVSMSISAWDSLEFTVVAQDQVRTRDLFWGETYGEDLIYTWLPRALFPWKPERYGNVRVQDLLVPELMANEGATFPPGILVEAFCNFGYLGVFLISLGIGIICRALYFRLEGRDWLWLVLMAISFYNLASFRGFSGFIALLMANAAVLVVVVVISRSMSSVIVSLEQMQPRPASLS